jgi:hypothetical protein
MVQTKFNFENSCMNHDIMVEHFTVQNVFPIFGLNVLINDSRLDP